MESEIANNVKKIIQYRCLKQSCVAKKAGYKPKVFSNILNGRKLVTDVDVIKIANALNVEVNDLFDYPSEEREWGSLSIIALVLRVPPFEPELCVFTSKSKNV